MDFSTSVEEIFPFSVTEKSFLSIDLCFLVRQTGGLALSLFIGSVLPLLFDKVARGSAVRIVVTAAYIYILQVVYAVWTSAYNFVPFGGTLTRETSHIEVFFNFLGIYFGVYTASRKICVQFDFLSRVCF